MKILSSLTSFAVIAFLIPVSASFAAGERGDMNAYISPLSQVKAAELPAECASLVSNADASQREAVTVSVVTASARINARAISAVVGAIAKDCPDMSSLAAGTAVELQPKQTSKIVRAAVGASPNHAGAIVQAVCLRQPGSYRSIAAIAAQLAPQQRNEILAAVGAALPSHRPFIEQALAGSSAQLGVAAVLEDASRLSGQTDLSTETIVSVRGPTVGPPYQPLTGTPSTTDPSATVDVPPGGRDYSAP